MKDYRDSTEVIILAAGMGTRMKSDTPKVLHPLLGKPMLAYILDAVAGLSDKPPIVVVGSGADLVKETIGDRARYVLQEPQLGTAHAVQCAKALVDKSTRSILVANSDFPLIRPETYQALADRHHAQASKLTITTVVADAPREFGRILRDEQGRVVRIVENKDATPEIKQIKELNSNPYMFDAEWLWESIELIEKSPAGEYYLTDLVQIAYQQGFDVAAIQVADIEESIGINNRIHLAEAVRVLQRRTNERWMLEGVTMPDPSQVYIDSQVTIGKDSVLYPGTYLRRNTVIGERCAIGPNVIMEDTTIGNDCKIVLSVLEKAVLEDHVDMGPFGHLRKGAHLAEHVHMGNFGEIKNSYLGPGTKMGHFSYVGDAEIGANVNIGAGTVTCNYDGEGKFKTVIGEGVFIGSDTMLVAPVKIGKGSKTGAGAVVTHDVPDDTIVVGVPARPLDRKNRDKDKKE